MHFDASRKEGNANILYSSDECLRTNVADQLALLFAALTQTNSCLEFARRVSRDAARTSQLRQMPLSAINNADWWHSTLERLFSHLLRRRDIATNFS